MTEQTRRHGGLRNLAVFLFFLLAACALCLPAVRDPGRVAIGDISMPGFQGEFFHQWDFLENARAGRLAQWYFSDRIAFPRGQDLREFIGFSLHLFFYLPFVWARDVAAPYNALVLVAMALNGFCAFLLCRRVSGSYWPAIAGGLIFMLAPYSCLKIGQGFLQKAVLWWIPLFVLYAFLFAQGRRRLHALAAGLAWAGMLLTYAPYAVYALVAGAWLLAAARRVPPGNGRAHPNLFAAGWPFLAAAVPAVAVLILVLPAAGLSQPGAALLPAAIADAPVGSLDLFNAWRFFPYAGFRAAPAVLPLGLPLAACAAAAAAVVRRRPGAVVFAGMALVFLVIALGPFPSKAGEILSRLPLPYYFMASFLPWGGRLGYSIRALPFLELAAVAAAAIAMGGIKRKRDGAPSRGLEFALAIGLLAVSALERAWFLPELFPPPVSNAAPGPDAEWLRDNAKVALHLPFNVRNENPHAYCYLAARSGTRMMNRYVDGLADGFPLPPLPSADPRDLFLYLAELKRLGVSHIAVHPEQALWPPPIKTGRDGGEIVVENYTPADLNVFRLWCGPPVYENPGSMIVYEIPALEQLAIALEQAEKFPPPPPAETLLWREALRLGLDQRPEVKAQVSEFRRRLAVDLLAREEVYPRIALEEHELRDYFERHRELYARRTQIRVHHFLVPKRPGADAEEKAATDEKIRAALEAVSAGAESAFALGEEMTRAGGGERWGDLGYIEPGRFPPELDEKLFAMREIGETVVFEDEAGCHIFKLMDIRPGREFEFEEVMQRVSEDALREARARELDLYVKSLAARHGPDDDMVHIPGGVFWMGSTSEEKKEASEMAARFAGRTARVPSERFDAEEYRLTRVRPFFLDRHEVTIGEYSRFLASTGHAPPLEWDETAPPDDALPVCGVSWHDAAAYAAWSGKRLPSAAEWEWAARGVERRRFPWGDEPPDGARANYADSSTDFPWNDPNHDDGFPGLAPVGQYPAGATPLGVMDMAGNVREWTASARLGLIDPRDNRIWPLGRGDMIPAGIRPEPMPMYIVKGGSFDGAADDLRGSDVRMLPPETRHPALGFRCARDAD